MKRKVWIQSKNRCGDGCHQKFINQLGEGYCLLFGCLLRSHVIGVNGKICVVFDRAGTCIAIYGSSESQHELMRCRDDRN